MASTATTAWEGTPSWTAWSSAAWPGRLPASSPSVPARSSSPARSPQSSRSSPSETGRVLVSVGLRHSPGAHGLRGPRMPSGPPFLRVDRAPGMTEA